MQPYLLETLDEDLKSNYLSELKLHWTNSSTQLEGNTLTLGETFSVLTDGLTIGGKSLREHQEVLGHAKAIDLLYAWYQTKKNDISSDDIFLLHRLIQNEIILDVYHPVGAYKNEPNSSLVILNNQSTVNDTYALPENVPVLMQQYLALLRSHLVLKAKCDAIHCYVELHLAWVHIHPFNDGNGRMARLLANLPLLYHGYPPILIKSSDRMEYIHLLARYQLDLGRLDTKLYVAQGEHYANFVKFIENIWQGESLLQKYLHLQQARERKKT